MTKRAGVAGNGGMFSSLCAGQIYGPDSTNPKSGRIIVADGETVWVHTTGLIPGDSIDVMQVIDGECVPYMPLPCVELCMDYQTTSIALGVSGTYALLINEEALGRVTTVTNIDCDQDSYMAWLKCYKEESMPKKIEAKDIDYSNPTCPFMTGVNDVDGALDVLAEELKKGTDDQTAAEVLMASGETVEECVTANKTASAANTAAIAALVDENTTYTFSNAVPNADGSACIITITGSDGSTQTSSVPKPVIPVESGTYLANVPPVIDLAAGTITYQTVNDVDETPGAPVVQDISALIAFLTSPMYVAGSNITLVDNGDGTITISATDTDTDTFVTVTQDATGTTFTPAGGGASVFVPVGTDIDNVDFTASGQTLTVSVDEGGNSVSDDLVIPDTTVCETPEKVLVLADGEMKFKPYEELEDISVRRFAGSSGTLVDFNAIPASTFVTSASTIASFTNTQPCKDMRFMYWASATYEINSSLGNVMSTNGRVFVAVNGAAPFVHIPDTENAVTHNDLNRGNLAAAQDNYPHAIRLAPAVPSGAPGSLEVYADIARFNHEILPGQSVGGSVTPRGALWGNTLRQI